MISKSFNTRLVLAAIVMMLFTGTFPGNAAFAAWDDVLSLEAEDGALSGSATPSTEHGGYTGWGAVRVPGGNGDIDLYFDSDGGTYDLAVRAYKGSCIGETVVWIRMNGVFLGNAELTCSFGAWKHLNKSGLELRKGRHHLRIGVSSSSISRPPSSGWPVYIDKATLTQKTPMIPVSSIRIEAGTPFSLGGHPAVEEGQTLPLNANIFPPSATYYDVTWSVVNPDGTPTDRATIDGYGFLNGVKTGLVKVIAASTDGSGVSGSAMVEICRTFEAEHAVFTGANFNNNHLGYSGTGFVETGGNILFDIGSPGEGVWSLYFHYAASVGADATYSLYANEQKVRQTVMPPTGGWHLWNIKEERVLLNSGPNTIRVRKDPGDNGWANLDCIYMVFQGPVVQASQITIGGAGNVTRIRPGQYLRMIPQFSPASASFQTLQWSVLDQNGRPTDRAVIDYKGEVYALKTGRIQVRGAAEDGSGIVATALIEIVHVLEMEDGELAGGTIVAANYPGYSGSGFCQVNADVTLRYHAEYEGHYDIDIRYANPAATAGTYSLYGNGEKVDQIDFPPSGSAWSDWAYRRVSIYLLEGENVVRIKKDGSDNGGANLDCMEFILERPRVPAEQVVINDPTNSSYLHAGQSLQLTAEVLPSWVVDMDKGIIWEVVNGDGSPTTRAAIDQTGLLSAIKPGYVTVIAIAENYPDIRGYRNFYIPDATHEAENTEREFTRTGTGYGNWTGTGYVVMGGVSGDDCSIYARMKFNAREDGTALPPGWYDIRIKYSTGFNADPITYELHIDGVKIKPIVFWGMPTWYHWNIQTERVYRGSPFTQVEIYKPYGLCAEVHIDWVSVVYAGVEIPVTGITVSGAGGVTHAGVGETLQMTADVSPADASIPSITWSVANVNGSPTDIASIDASGVLTANRPGSVKVRAEAQDGYAVAGETVIIVGNTYEAENATVSDANVNNNHGGFSGTGFVEVGATIRFDTMVFDRGYYDFSIRYANATSGPATYSLYVGDEKIKRFELPATSGWNDWGVITERVPVGSPFHEITLRKDAEDNGHANIDWLNIEYAGELTLVSRIGVSGAGGAIAVSIGHTLQMSAHVTPVDASIQTVTWSVVNPDGSPTETASIDGAGMVSGLATGFVKVRATARDGSGVTGEANIAVGNVHAVVLELQVPEPVVAGQVFSVMITAKDASGQPAASYPDSQNLTWSWTATASPNGTAPVKPADAAVSFTGGAATVGGFMLTNAGETPILTVVDEFGAQGVCPPIVVNPSGAVGFSVEARNTVAAGEPFAVTVTAKDIFGNTATGYRGTVRFSGSDGSGLLPDDYTFTEADNGVRVFENIVQNTTGGQSVSAFDPSMAPDAYWKLDEGEGAAARDSSGNDHDATLASSGAGAWTSDAPTAVQFPDPYALHLGGTESDYASTGEGIDLAGRSFTIAFWARRTDTDGRWIVTQGSASANQGLHVGFRDHDTFSLAFWSDDLDVDLVEDFDWHHWVVTYDSGQRYQRIYRDGTQLGSRVSTGPLQSSGPIYIGKSIANIGAFKGDLDDLRVYYRALPAEEIGFLAGGADLFSGDKAVSVRPPDVSSFAMSLPSVVEAGDIFSVQLTAKNASGQTETGLFGERTIQWTWNAADSPNGTPPVKPADGAVTFTGGVATVSGFMLTRAGQGVTVTATAPTENGAHGSGYVAVEPSGAAASFTIDTPDTIVAGLSFSVTVKAWDRFGNLATGYAGTVSFAGTDPAGEFPATCTFEAGDNGVRVFNVIFNGTGSRSLAVREAEALDGYWRFDEGQGITAFDSSGNGNHGTVVNPAYSGWSDDVPIVSFENPYSLQLGGTYDYVDAGSGIDLSHRSFTVAAWARNLKTTGSSFILSTGTIPKTQNKYLHIGFRDPTHFTFAFYSNDLDAVVPGDNEWHHWAATYDDSIGERKIYRDGLEIAQDVSVPLEASGVLHIGRNHDAAKFGGHLDDLRIYLRPLSPEEIGSMAEGRAAVPYEEAAVFVKAPVVRAATDASGTVISLFFSKEMTDPAGKEDQFTVLVNGEAREVRSIALSPADPTRLVLSLEGRPVGHGDLVTFGYTAGDMTSADGRPLGSFTGQSVTNFVPRYGEGKKIAAGDYHSLAVRPDGTVAAWGCGLYGNEGQCDAPVWLSQVTAVDAGDRHSLALKSNGTVAAWGYNWAGQCDVPATLRDVSAISGGGNHSLALRRDGTVAAWGYNGYGQSSVPAGLNDVVAIAAGARSSLALRSDGTVRAWGEYGQGFVPEGLVNVVAVAAGGNHFLALKADGSVAAWGANYFDVNQIPAGLGQVVAVTAGYFHSMALASDGAVTAWGSTDDGRCTVPAGLSDVAAIAAGDRHSLALRVNGEIVAWGNNGFGQSDVPAGLNLAGRLSGLQLGGGFLSPAFDPDTRNYVLTVPYGLSSLPVTAFLENPGDLLRIDGQTAESGVAATVALAQEPGTVSITVARSGESLTRTYTLAAVRSAGATSFTVSAPASVTAGEAFSVQLSARNDQGQIETGYFGGHAIAWTWDALASLDETEPVKPADGTAVFTDGVATVSGFMLPRAAEAVTLTATDEAGIPGSASITVYPADVAVFSIEAPHRVGAGTAFDVTVSARDRFGNIVTGYVGPVGLTGSDAGGVLPSGEIAEGGRETFSVTLNTGGEQSLTASDGYHAGLKGYWMFDEGAGTTAYDSSGLWRNGTMSGFGPDPWISGAPGIAFTNPFALRLDGINDSISAADFGNWGDLAGESFSIAFWARRSALEEGWIVSHGYWGNQALHVGFRDADTFSLAFLGDDLDVDVTGDTGWHHWTVTFDHDTRMQRIYLDGDEIGSRQSSGYLQSSGPLYIGKTVTGGRNFGGDLDDLRIYDRVIPDSVIAGLAEGRGALAYGSDAVVTVVSADLSELELSAGKLVPELTPNVTDYTAAVGNHIDSITVTPTAEDPDAAITVDGEPVDSGSASQTIPLAVATPRTISLTVAVPDASAKTYTITVTRSALAQSFTVSAPEAIKAGEIFDLQLTALSASGQIETYYVGDHTIAWDWTAGISPNGTEPVKPEPGPVTFTDGVATVSGFMLTRTGQGDTSITAADGAGAAGTSAPVTVYPGPGIFSIETTEPVRAEQPFAITVTVVEDIFGNPPDGYAGTIAFSSNDPQAQLPARYTFDAGGNGVKVFYNAVTYRQGEVILSVVDVENGPYGYWRFDEGAGYYALDSSGNGNTAVTGNMDAYAPWVSGVPGLSFDNPYGLRLDGPYDYVRVANGPDLSGKSFTISFWARRSGSGQGWIVRQGTGNINQGLHVGFRDEDTFSLAFWGNDLDVAVNEDFEWHHWAASYDHASKYRRIYLDGVEMGADVSTGDLYSSGPVVFGAGFDFYAPHFRGDLDDLRIYLKALPVDEIVTAAQGGAVCQDKIITVLHPLPKVISAATNTSGTAITLTFDAVMADPAGKHDQFSATVNSVSRAFSKVVPDAADAKKFHLALSGAPVVGGNLVTVSYAPGDVAAADGRPLAPLAGRSVTNNVHNAGGENNPYSILDAGQLGYLRQHLNNSNVYFRLEADIDLSAYPDWEPIGASSESAFRGTLWGNGKTIRGLTIDRTGRDNVGLFGYIDCATIQDLRLEDVVVKGGKYTGALVGYNRYGTIRNSCASGAVSGSTYVGGLVGHNGGAVHNSCATGAVSGSGETGALVGANGGQVVGSYATGSVSGGTGTRGGLAGSNSGTISGSYATGSVSEGSGDRGGLVGFTYGVPAGTVIGSYWNTETTGCATSAGGGEGKTTAQMKQEETFEGWDFAGAWSIIEDVSYPYFQWVGYPDLDPPAFAAGYPAVSGLTGTSFTLKLETEENATVYFVVLTADAPAPTAAQVVEGKDAAGAAVADNLRGEISLEAHAMEEAPVDGLNPSLSYDVHIVAEGEYGNRHRAPVRLRPSAAPPQLLGAATNIGSTVITLAFDQPMADPSGKQGFFSTFVNGAPRAFSAAYRNPSDSQKIDLIMDGGPIECGETVTVSYTPGDVSSVSGGLAAEITDAPVPVEACLFQAGQGTLEDPYVVMEAAQLVNLVQFLGVSGVYFRLEEDMDLSAYSNWEPIGTSQNPFKGIFWGNGKTITGLTINRPGSAHVGLFGYIQGAVIQDLRLEAAVVHGGENTGALAGSNHGGTISGSCVEADVSGGNRAGALVGHNAGSALDSCATGTVSGSYYVGGLVGYNDGAISRSYAENGASGVGAVGGLAGYNGGTVSDSYATGSVSATDGYAGGLVGLIDGSISKSYTTGHVQGWYYVGGLAGGSGGSFSSSYWNTDTDGIMFGSGIGKTTAEMKQAETFTDWDFETVWRIAEGHTYPILRWQPLTVVDEILLDMDALGWDDIKGDNTDGPESVTVNLELPTSGAHGTTISWEASVSGWIDTNTGVVTRPAFEIGDRSVTLTATISKDGGTSKTKEFPLTIKALEEEELVWRGDGTAGDPFQVESAAHLHDIRNHLDKYFIQTADITLPSVGPGESNWIPIGDWNNPFTGTYNGGVFTISGLKIDVDDEYAGMFGVVGSGGTLDNIKLENVNIRAFGRAGGLVGENDGTVSNSHATGSVSGDFDAGGLVGYNAGIIAGSYATGSVSGDWNAGGLVGSNSGAIGSSYARSDVSGADNAGGLAGENSGAISSSYAAGSVTGEYVIGGLVGGNWGSISNSYATGSVSGGSYSEIVGGLVGENDGSISSSYATGSVSGYRSIGGLVGSNYFGTVGDCYATGSVSASFGWAGGLAGENYGTISNSYATGSVPGNYYVGGLVGENFDTVSDSYWNTETSGRSTSAGGDGKTTAQLMQQEAFAGWDFFGAWGIVNGVTYPYLQWQGYDALAPTGEIAIQGGSAYTAIAAVTLHLAATDDVGVTGYYLSTADSPVPSATDAGWAPVQETTNYAADISYTITGEDGPKTLHVWYKDAAGNVSETASASIILAVADTDGDGLPDLWETAHGLDPNDSSGINGAGGDPNGDGITNLAHFQAGSHPINRPPVAVADQYGVDLGQSLVAGAGQGVLANDTDPNGDSLTVELVSGPAKGTLTLSADGGFTYQHGGGSGNDSFTYRAWDGLAYSATATVTLKLYAQSEADRELSVSPVTARFGVTTIGGSSMPTEFTVKNAGTGPRILGSLSLSGPDDDQFAFEPEMDLCSGVTLAAGGECTVEVAFKPTSTGSKSAVLLIPNDDLETPTLVAFLSNYEGKSEEACRRMPPVLTSITMNEPMTAGREQYIEWTVLGYAESYQTYIALFDCTGMEEGACGATYGGADRFEASGALEPEVIETGSWTYGNLTTRAFTYRYAFTPDPARFTADETPIVLRYYVRSAGDAVAGQGGISLLVPGNLDGVRYYDDAGRRIEGTIVPE